MAPMPARTLGMELKVVGKQLILSGRVVVGDEPEKVQGAFKSSPRIGSSLLNSVRFRITVV
jgi:hypothetical protein